MNRDIPVTGTFLDMLAQQDGRYPQESGQNSSPLDKLLHRPPSDIRGLIVAEAAWDTANMDLANASRDRSVAAAYAHDVLGFSFAMVALVVGITDKGAKFRVLAGRKILQEEAGEVDPDVRPEYETRDTDLYPDRSPADPTITPW